MDDEATPGGVEAGWHIWLVGGLGVLWNGYGCFDFVMTVSRNKAYLAAYPPEMVTYLFSMPWWMFGIWAVGVFGAFFGSVMLLLKRRDAVTLFAAAFVASFFSLVTGALDQNAPRMEGMEFFPWLVMVLGLGFLAYAYWQQRRGVLR